MALTSYLSQLDALCTELNVDLAAACKAEGLADTTLARWRKGEAHCRYDVARKLFDRIRGMASERQGRAA